MRSPTYCAHFRRGIVIPSRRMSAAKSKAKTKSIGLIGPIGPMLGGSACVRTGLQSAIRPALLAEANRPPPACNSRPQFRRFFRVPGSGFRFSVVPGYRPPATGYRLLLPHWPDAIAARMGWMTLGTMILVAISSQARHCRAKDSGRLIISLGEGYRRMVK